jgi:hypothetical protein
MILVVKSGGRRDQLTVATGVDPDVLVPSQVSLPEVNPGSYLLHAHAH